MDEIVLLSKTLCGPLSLNEAVARWPPLGERGVRLAPNVEHRSKDRKLLFYLISYYF
jgi:hypothetical protein